VYPEYGVGGVVRVVDVRGTVRFDLPPTPSGINTTIEINVSAWYSRQEPPFPRSPIT